MFSLDVKELNYPHILTPEYIDNKWFNTIFFSVYADGSICLDILQNQWSPIYDVAAILTSIQVLLILSLNLSC